jgi:hypothetical protein
MGLTADRTEFMAIMRAEQPPMPATVARQIMRHADTIQRIAYEDSSVESAYLANEARRATCVVCAKEAPSDRVYLLGPVPRRCPEHRAESAIRELCSPYHVTPSFDGDPRGACVKLKVPSGWNNSFGGGGWICVPTREY